jgi:hypothetical protein
MSDWNGGYTINGCKNLVETYENEPYVSDIALQGASSLKVHITSYYFA